MENASLWHRLLRQVFAVWRTLTSVLGLGPDPDTDAHTRVTFRAVADAVVPRTPELADEPGPEHVPGGMDVGLGDFLVVYVNDLFQLGLPGLGPRGNIPLAGPVANVLDAAALTLLERGENAAEPSHDRVLALLDPDDTDPTAGTDAAGTFAELSPEDRLRALGILDEFEIEIRGFDDELFELDAGLVGQLVIGFAEMIYYSEWQGYGEFARPPSELAHPNDPSAVQSWRQTGYPGTAPGYAALRGYLGTDDGSLGGGDVWATVDPDAPSPVNISHEAGSFRENEYDTSGYVEPYPEEVA
jgi:hypothetical protein